VHFTSECAIGDEEATRSVVFNLSCLDDANNKVVERYLQFNMAVLPRQSIKAETYDRLYTALLPGGFQHPALTDPEYVPEDRELLLGGFAIGTLAISVIIVAARLYSRLKCIKKLARDDWVIVAALVGGILSIEYRGRVL
jgi:hypothetical protein